MVRGSNPCRSRSSRGLRRGLVAARLLGLRVRIPPAAWMFVLCVFYGKDKRQNPGQSGQRNTNKVQSEWSKARVCGRSLAGVAGSNPTGGMDVCVVCCK